MALVGDTGAIFALYDVADRHHEAVSTALRHTKERIHLPSALLGELGYLLLHWLGTEALLQFLDDLTANAFELEAFRQEDAIRCRELAGVYADLNLGLCEAAVVATAERLGIDRILTVDERDFRIVRSHEGKSFTLLPADLEKGKRRG